MAFVLAVNEEKSPLNSTNDQLINLYDSTQKMFVIIIYLYSFDCVSIGVEYKYTISIYAYASSVNVIIIRHQH